MKITPNQITWSRIILIPVIIFFYLSSSFIYCGKLVAAGIFAVACLTDFLDGYLARKYNLVTNLGKFLDSIADKLLVVCGFILIVADNTILAPYGVIALCIIVAREFIVSALRQIGATKNVVIQADMWGKVKANFQFFAVIFFMIYSFFLDNPSALFNGLNLYFFILCYLLLGVTVLATVISGGHYLIAFKDVFKNDKGTSCSLKDQEIQEGINKESESLEILQKKVRKEPNQTKVFNKEQKLEQEKESKQTNSYLDKNNNKAPKENTKKQTKSIK